MIEGSLRNVPLSDVFQIIATSLKSGILTVTQLESRARIYFEMGRIQYAYLTPGVHLGEVLVRMELLTTYEVQQILLKQKIENPGTPLGLTAIVMGFLDQDDLKQALRTQISEVITELMFWRRGNFHFAEKSPMASQVPTEHAFDAMMLLMDVIKRVDTWKAGYVEPDIVLERVGDPSNVTLPEDSWETLGYVNGKRSAASIAAELDMSEKQVYSTLFQLKEFGIIRPVSYKVEEPSVLIISSSSALQRLIKLALRRVGLAPHLTDTFHAGMKFILEDHPQAIVVDEYEGEGWDFVKEIRKLPGRSHLPILLLSNEQHHGNFFDRFKRPKAQILLKPFQEVDFQRVISQLAGKPIG
jgi:CheY-like chemotaxis protein